MPQWTPADLDRIGRAHEVTITTRRADGTPRPGVPIWVVRVGDDLFVRSWHGRSAAWFRHALERHEARIRAGALERDVTVEEQVPGDAVQQQIDRGYRTKYARSGAAYVDPMVAPEAVAATLRLLPR